MFTVCCYNNVNIYKIACSSTNMGKKLTVPSRADFTKQSPAFGMALPYYPGVILTPPGFPNHPIPDPTGGQNTVRPISTVYMDFNIIISNPN